MAREARSAGFESTHTTPREARDNVGHQLQHYEQTVVTTGFLLLLDTITFRSRKGPLICCCSLFNATPEYLLEHYHKSLSNNIGHSVPLRKSQSTCFFHSFERQHQPLTSAVPTSLALQSRRNLARVFPSSMRLTCPFLCSM